MIHTFNVYFEVLEGFRRKALSLIVLLAVSGLLEGAALTALMPLINEHLKSLNTSSFELFGKAYEIHNHTTLILGIIGVFFLLGILSAGAKLITEWQLLRLRIALERAYNERLVQAILNARWTTFVSIRFGDIANGLNMESRNISFGATAAVSMFGLSLIALIFLTLGYALSPHLIILTLGFGSLMGFIFRIVSSRFVNRSEKLSSGSAQINHDIQQLLGNLKFMRSTGLSKSIADRMSTSFRNYEAIFFSSHVYNPIMRFIFESVGIAFVSAIVIISAWTTPASLGRVIIFLAVFYRLAPRLAGIQEQYGIAVNYQNWYHSWQTLYQRIAQHPDLVLKETGLKVPALLKSIGSEGVQFAYGERPVLKNINWQLTEGRCLAFVGESGSGKTTMLDLITGILKPTQGQLLLNDMPLHQMDLESWQMRIGLVMQNSPMFHTTLLENIAWGDPSPDIERAQEAAKMAHAWDFIARLPEKFNTTLGDKGAQFSGGECQRIALARALYRKPWLLILDEATNALDAESEAIIHKTLQQLKGKITLLMVMHRLQAAEWADEILVFDQGEIVERGTFHELIRYPTGYFRKLAQLQGLLN